MPPPPADDYYSLLGVHAGADNEDLRRAWRQLALRWHPDRAGDGATATFQRISVAYTVLSDPIARAAYDRRRRPAEPRAASAAPPATATSPAPKATRQPAPAVMLSRISGQLDTLLARGIARLDEPGFITLVLREHEAVQGGMATISMRVDLWCPSCATKERARGCTHCGGTRKVEELFSAWLAVPPGVTAGEVLAPSVELPGMVEPVRFRVQLSGVR